MAWHCVSFRVRADDHLWDELNPLLEAAKEQGYFATAALADVECCLALVNGGELRELRRILGPDGYTEHQDPETRPWANLGSFAAELAAPED